MKYWTIQEFVAARHRRVEYTIVLIGWLLAVSIPIALHFAPHSTPMLIEGTRVAADLNDRGDNARWDKWYKPAKSAAQKWADAGLVVPEFRMIAGEGNCGPKAIACCDVGMKTIFLQQDGDGVDRTTIMMHEIGHLLGVPHIEGDPLMDKIYSGKALSKPTDFAVSIAKDHASFNPQIEPYMSDEDKAPYMVKQ